MSIDLIEPPQAHEAQAVIDNGFRVIRYWASSRCLGDDINSLMGLVSAPAVHRALLKHLRTDVKSSHQGSR